MSNRKRKNSFFDLGLEESIRKNVELGIKPQRICANLVLEAKDAAVRSDVPFVKQVGGEIGGKSIAELHTGVTNVARALKRSRQSKSFVSNTVELQAWASERALPERAEDMEPWKPYAVPVDRAHQGDMTGVIFTMHVQAQWIKQCGQHPQGFVIHLDGTHKLHHGG